MKKIVKIIIINLFLFNFSTNLLSTEKSANFILDKDEEKVAIISWNLQVQNAKSSMGEVSSEDLINEANEAIKKYEEILRAKPDCIYVQIEMASAYLVKKEFDKSEQIIRKILPQLKSSSYNKLLLFRDLTLFNLGLALEYQDKYTDACKVYENAYKDFLKVLKKNPNNIRLKEIVAKYEKLIWQVSVKMHIKDAEKFAEKKNYEQAIALYGKAQKIKEKKPDFIKDVELYSDGSDLYKKMGDIYREWSKERKAIEMYEKQVSENNDIWSYIKLLEIYFENKNYKKSEEIIMSIFRIEPENKIAKRYLEEIKQAKKVSGIKE